MKKLLAIFTMAVLCGVVVATDSFALDCSSGYTAGTVSVDPATLGLDPDIVPTDYTSSSFNSGNGTWDVTAPYGHVTGIATCNTTSGSGATAYPQYNFEQGTTGGYCWCRMLSPARSAWVYYRDSSSAAGCAANCARSCSSAVRYGADFRSAMFNSITEDACVANTINVNWQNATGTTGSSSSCTYDGTLTTPAAAPAKRGYTFTGWVAQ